MSCGSGGGRMRETVGAAFSPLCRYDPRGRRHGGEMTVRSDPAQVEDANGSLQLGAWSLELPAWIS